VGKQSLERNWQILHVVRNLDMALNIGRRVSIANSFDIKVIGQKVDVPHNPHILSRMGG
jgi:hypothetical protein